jgi:prevent-host-death family protein
VKIVNVNEAKANFATLIAAVKNNGESYIICRNGKPVADLVPHKLKNRIKPHPLLSRIKIKYNPAESAPEGDWPKCFR